MKENEELLHRELTGKIIGAFYEVYKTLGYGFLEKVYKNAMVLELRRIGLRVVAQKRLRVYYGDQIVGDYFADLVVEGLVIVEIKAAVALNEAFVAQLQNYLKATEIEVGLLMNFGPEPAFQRKAFSNDRKKIRHTLLNTDNPNNADAAEQRG